MRNNWLRWTVLAVVGLLLALAAARPAYAARCDDSTNVVGDSYTLSAGSELDRNLIVMGGNATIEPGAHVACTIVVFGGNLDLAGTVDEDVVVFGGNTTLHSTAVVNGELVAFGGSTARDEGAVVRGGQSQGFAFRGGRPWRLGNFDIPFVDPVLNFYRSVFETLFTALGMGLLALLVVLFWPEHAARVSAAVTTAPGPALGLGLLTAVAVPVLALLVALTICLAPISFVAGLLLVAAIVFGWIGLGMTVGARLSTALRMYSLSPAVSAALGTAVLTLVMRAIDWIPCFGWVPPLIVGLIGLGAVMLTRFGTRPYLPGATAGSVPPASPPSRPPETGDMPLVA